MLRPAACDVWRCRFWRSCFSRLVSELGVEESDAGGSSGRAGAASGEQPAGEGSLPQEPPLAAGAAGRQDLRADGAARHAGQTAGGQLERPTAPPPPPPPPSPQPALREESPACRYIATDTKLECLFVSFLFHSCPMRQFVYTRLDAFTVLILLGTRLHTSQVKRAWLMPSLRSDRHVHTLNQSLWFLSECRSVWRDVDFLIYFAPTIIKTST